ncbi:unnamed protein product [Mesocestoides corti]|uniref:Uncharacterized protein n=2 Tax=Mesocestoides corti TaxID=53468 RepID=A0A0R3UIG6_MESCO|nr:unnamed protein product [Mesocestoides corti]
MLSTEVITPVIDVCVMLIMLPYIEWVMLGIAAVYGMRIVAFCVTQVAKHVDEMPVSSETSGTSESAIEEEAVNNESFAQEEEDRDSKEAGVLERPLFSTPEILVMPPSIDVFACASPLPREAHEASLRDHGCTKSLSAAERIGYKFEVNEIVHSQLDRDATGNDTIGANWSVGRRDRRRGDGDKEFNSNNEMPCRGLLASEFVHTME